MKSHIRISLIGILICAGMAAYSDVRAATWATGVVSPGSEGSAAGHEPSEQILRFRRIYVPEGRSDLLTVPGVRMVPMKRDMFERIMRSADADESAVETPSIVETVCHARLDPTTGILYGTSQWRVHATDGKSQVLRIDPCQMAIRRLLRTSDATTDTPSVPAVESDGTTGDDTVDDTDDLPLELRVLPGIDRSGRVGVIVDGPCTLVASWALRSDIGAVETATDGGRKPFVFPWNIPSSLTGELILELPEGMVPKLDGAVITRLPDVVTGPVMESWSAEPTTGSGMTVTGNSANDVPVTQRLWAWKILFPNYSEPVTLGSGTAVVNKNPTTTLRIFPSDPNATILPEAVAPGVRQSLVCTALRHHLEITSTFVPQPGFQFPSTVELRFTHGVRILDIRLNDVVVPYEMVVDSGGDVQKPGGEADADGEADERFDRIRLFLPNQTFAPTMPTSAEHPGELMLTAQYPIPETSSENEISMQNGTNVHNGISVHNSFAAADGVMGTVAALPSEVGIPRFLPDGLFQELTTVILIVPEPHVPEELVVTDGRQVFSGPIWSPVSERSYGFQLFSSHGKVRFRPGNPGVPFFASSGTTVSFDGLSVRTLTVAECWVSEGERFGLQLPLADGWKIESVTAEDPGVLRDWSVFPRESEGEPDDDIGQRSAGFVPGTEQLLIQLRRPLTSEMPVVLRIAACGPETPIGSHRRGGELLPFMFPASEADTWIAFRQSPFCLWRSLETTPLPRTPWGRVRESLRRLFPQSVRSIQAWTDIMDHPFILEAPEEDYSVEQKVMVEFCAEAIRETTELGMNVRSPGIDRVRIRYREPRITPPLWTMLLVPAEDATAETGLVETGISRVEAMPSAAVADTVVVAMENAFMSGSGPEATFTEPLMAGNGTGGTRRRGVVIEPVEVVPIPTETAVAETNATDSADDTLRDAGTMAVSAAVAGDPVTAEGFTTWELRFGRPVENVFTLCEQRIRTLDSPLEMSVVNIPSANRQSGLLIVSKSPETGIRNHQLEAISGDPEEMRFTFDPDLIAASPDPVFEFLPQAHFPKATAVRVWESTLLSTMVADGEFYSRIVWKLENEGVTRFPIRLPVGWDVSRIEDLRLYDRNSGQNFDLVAARVTDWLVGVPDTNGTSDETLNENTSENGDHGGANTGMTIFVRLPVDRRYLTLSMAWRTPTSGSFRQFRLTPEIPQPLVPVLYRTQQIALPPEYQLVDVTGDGFTTSTFRRVSPMERFFGVLARPTDEPGTTDGGTYSSWFSGMARESATGDALLTALTEVAETMPATPKEADVANDGLGDVGPTWGELLRVTVEHLAHRAASDTEHGAAANMTHDGSVPVILVDRTATGKAGIFPESVVRFPENRDSLRSSPDSASQRGMLLLENSGLTLLVYGHTALITTRSRAAFHRRGLAAIGDGCAWAVLPGPLGDRLRGDATHRDTEFIPVVTWWNLPSLAAGPWSLWSPASTPFPMTADPMFQAERTGDQPLTFVVSDRFFRSGIEVAVLMMALGAVLSLPKVAAAMRESKQVMRRVPSPLRMILHFSRIRPRVRMAIRLLCVAAMMAVLLILPETMIGIGRGIFWGTCAGFFIIAGRRRIKETAAGETVNRCGNVAWNSCIPKSRRGVGRRSRPVSSLASPSTEPFIPAHIAEPHEADPASSSWDTSSTTGRTSIRTLLPWLMLTIGLVAATHDVSVAQENETFPTVSPIFVHADADFPDGSHDDVPESVKPVSPESSMMEPQSSGFFPTAATEPLELSIPTTRLSPEVGRLLMGVSMPREIPVLIPVDPKTLNSGEQVYVPLDFHGVLSRQAEASQRIIDGWQLLGASYQMQLRTDRAEWLCRVESFRCIFEFEVVEPDSLIRIPLGSRQWIPRMNELILDGRRTAGSWLVSESVLLIPVAQTGRMVLEVPMRMTPRRENGRIVCEGRIPPLPEATFDLEIADERGVHFRVDSAIGPDLPDGRSRWRWFPGATDRLVWSWSESVSTLETVNIAAELDETTLLRFTQDGVALDASWKFRNLTEPVNCFEVLCPPDMEMVPLKSNEVEKDWRGLFDGEIIALRCGSEMGTAERTQRGYLCRFAGRIGSGAPVEATFQARSSPMTGTTGIGKRRIPELRIPAVHTTRRRMILCTAPELELEFERPASAVSSGSGVESVTAMTLPLHSSASPEELAKMKFHGAMDPDAAVGPLMVTVRTSPVQTQVEQQMVYGFQKDRVQIELSARMRILSGAVFQYAIDAPPELEIEEIRVTDEEVAIPSRWSRSATGRITLFLDVPATSRQEIRLLGWIPVKCPGDWTVPTIRVVGSTRLPDTLEIFRRESVRVGVRRLSGFEPTESTAAASASGTSVATGRLVAAYREIVAGDEFGASGSGVVNENATVGSGMTSAEETTLASMTVSLEPNSPRIVGSTWSWLRPATASEMVVSAGPGSGTGIGSRSGNISPSLPLPPPPGSPIAGRSGGPLNGGAQSRGTAFSLDSVSDGSMSGTRPSGGTPSSGDVPPGAWRMSLFVDLQIDSGVVDTFRIPLPTGWTEPFTCSRTMMLELSENNATGARYLSVRPAQPTSGHVQFTVTGTLQGRETATLPRLPVIHLEHGEDIVEHAILPTQYEQREVLWNVPSWADGELPGPVAQTLGIPVNQLSTLRTVRIPETLSGSAWITASRRLMRRPPRLALAAISCSWFEDGSVLGRGRYLIEPGGRREAELTLPAGVSLIAVTAGDQVVQAENVQHEPNGGNRIRFPFGPPDLPQQVTLLWKQSAVRKSGHTLTLMAPIWNDFQPQQTLWQVLSPPGRTIGTHDGTVIHTGEYPLVLLEQLTSMLEIGVDVLRDRPEEASRWIAPWSDHWERNRRWFLNNMAMETVAAPIRLQYDSLVRRHTVALAEFQQQSVAPGVTGGVPPDRAGRADRGNSENAGFTGLSATVFSESETELEEGTATATATLAGLDELRVTPLPDPVILHAMTQPDSGEKAPPILCVVASGEMVKMTLECELGRSDPDGGATALFVVMTALLLIAGWLLIRPDTPIRPVMKNEPIGSMYRVPVLLLLAGIFCGLWLQPAAIGGGFVVLAVVLAVRIARRRSARRHESHLPES